MHLFRRFFILPLVLVAACGPIKKEASYPDKQRGSDKPIYSDQKRETIWGDDKSLGAVLFGRDGDENSAGSAGIGVNSFLWRASLDTISFMPVASADPFGGVILTDWYENPDVQGERFKLNVYILDKQLRADGVRVAVFKQKREGKAGAWRDAKVPDTMAADLENSILTRARSLRVAALGSKK